MASFRFDRFTLKAQEAVQAAQALADRESHQQIEPEHLLAALLAQPEGVVAPLLGKLGARPEALRQEAEAELTRLPKVTGAGGQYVSPRLKAVLDAAWGEAERLKDDYCSTEHLLIALAQEKDGAAARLLRTIVLPVPGERTKGVVLTRTIFGNLLVGPTAEEQEDRDRATVEHATLAALIARAVEMVPGLADMPVTATYAGLRPATELPQESEAADARGSGARVHAASGANVAGSGFAGTPPALACNAAPRSRRDSSSARP